MSRLSEIESIYRRHADEVHRFALRLSRSREQAEDLTAETFVRAIAGADGLRAETARAFLFTITRRLFLQGLRRTKRETSDVPDMADPGPSPEQRAVQADELARIRERIEALPEIDRSALLLRAELGLSYEEIARILSISAVAAKVKVHRVRQRLASAREERS